MYYSPEVPFFILWHMKIETIIVAFMEVTTNFQRCVSNFPKKIFQKKKKKEEIVFLAAE